MIRNSFICIIEKEYNMHILICSVHMFKISFFLSYKQTIESDLA